MSQQHEEKNSYYITVLSEVIEDKDIVNDKFAFFIYCFLIKLCSNGNGYCFASNSYLSKQCKVSCRKLQLVLSMLHKKHYIAIDYSNEKRLIYLPEAWYRKLKKENKIIEKINDKKR